MPWMLLMGALAMFWILADLADIVLDSSRSHRSGYTASSAWLDWSADRLLSATERRHHAIGMADDTDGYCDDSRDLDLWRCLSDEFGFTAKQDQVAVDAALGDRSDHTGRPLLLHGGVDGYPSRYANAIVGSPAANSPTSAKDYGLIRGRVHAGYYQSDPLASGVDARQRNGMLWLRDPAHVTGDPSGASVDRYHRLVNAPENYLPHVPLGILAGWHQGDPADPTDDAPPVAAALPIVPDFDNPDALRVPYSHRSDVVEKVFDRFRCYQRTDGGTVSVPGCDDDWDYHVLPGSLPNGMSLADLAGVAPDRAAAFLHPFTVSWDPLGRNDDQVMGHPCQWSDCWAALPLSGRESISPFAQGKAAQCPHSDGVGLSQGRLGHACLPGDKDDPRSWAFALARRPPTLTDDGRPRILPPPYEHFERLGTGASSGERTQLSPDLVDTGLKVELPDPADPTSPLKPPDNWFSLHWMIVGEDLVDADLLPIDPVTSAPIDPAGLPAFGPCRQLASPPAFCRRHLSH